MFFNSEIYTYIHTYIYTYKGLQLLLMKVYHCQRFYEDSIFCEIPVSWCYNIFSDKL